MDLVLVLLVVSLELVELDEHHGLLLAQVASERLPNVRDERDHDRERLRRERCYGASASFRSYKIVGEELDVPRCLAVMFFNPAERIAPAPRTTWHVRELNAFRSSITRPIVSVASISKFSTSPFQVSNKLRQQLVPPM